MEKIKLKPTTTQMKKLDTISNIIDNIKTLEDAHNLIIDFINHQSKDTVIEKVVNTPDGKLEIDLSDFNFNNIDDYALQISCYGDKPVTASIIKISKDKAKVFLTDHTKWEFNEDRFYDGKDLVVVITVTRLV